MSTPTPTGPPSQLRQARQDTVALSVLITVVLVGFAVTTWMVRRYDAERAARAWNWQRDGGQALQHGKPRVAAEDYRNALAYNSDNAGYQFGLGTALFQSGELNQARHYFSILWQRTPQSGPVNLSLARVEAKDGNASAAVRYYHNAIYGLWKSNGAAQREAARRELIAFLLRQGEENQADAEILALGATLPPTAAARIAIGQQLLAVGDNHHALQEFQSALRRGGNNYAALVGAGRASFRLAQYAQARNYLQHAVRLRPHDIVAAPLLATTNQVLELDPYAFGVSRPQRDERVRHDLKIALARLHRCLPAPAPATAGGKAKAAAAPAPPAVPANMAKLAASGKTLQQQLARGRLFHGPDAVSQTMGFVFQVEQATAATCGAPTGSDLALLLIARQRAGGGQ